MLLGVLAATAATAAASRPVELLAFGTIGTCHRCADDFGVGCRGTGLHVPGAEEAVRAGDAGVCISAGQILHRGRCVGLLDHGCAAFGVEGADLVEEVFLGETAAGATDGKSDMLVVLVVFLVLLERVKDLGILDGIEASPLVETLDQFALTSLLSLGALALLCACLFPCLVVLATWGLRFRGRCLGLLSVSMRRKIVLLDDFTIFIFDNNLRKLVTIIYNEYSL